MVGKLFRVIFSRKSRQRLKDISDYNTRTASSAVSKKIRQGIIKEARKLEKLPASKPPLPDTDDYDYEVRYTKAWSFKIIFKIIGDIVNILTIRHDREDPKDIKEDLK